jgi:TRAP-type C4-dicarboxylate transport system substrate-binding protein
MAGLRPALKTVPEDAAMIRTTRRTLLLGGAGVVAMPWVSRAQQLKAEYKLSVVGNRPIPLSEGAFQWAELVTQRTNGRINVKVYPGSQLVGGDQTRELVAMRQGIIDFTVSSTINLSPQVKEMTLYSMPFLMPNHKAFDALIGGEVGQDLFKIMATRDVVPLAWGENGFRELSNSKRTVRKPEDLKGMKIRYAAGPIFADVFNALGANPLQMSFADSAAGALDRRGRRAGKPDQPVPRFKMDTLAQKHLTIWNYCADAGLFHVAKPVWDTFSKADQEIITEVRARSRQAADGVGAQGHRRRRRYLVARRGEETRRRDRGSHARRKGRLRQNDASCVRQVGGHDRRRSRQESGSRNREDA